MEEESKDGGLEHQAGFSRWGQVYLAVVVCTAIVISFLYAFSVYYGG